MNIGLEFLLNGVNRRLRCAVTAAALIFSACSFDQPLQGRFSTDVLKDVSSGDTVYLVKFNRTGADVAAEDTGYVVSWTAGRNAAEQDRSGGSLLPDCLSGGDTVPPFVRGFYAGLPYAASPSRSTARSAGSSPDSSGGCVFHIQADGGATSDINAVLKSAGKRCNVWYFRGDDEPVIPDSDFYALASKFDMIYGPETDLLCSPLYENASAEFITPSDKIDILVYDIYGDGEDGSVVGYFYPADMYGHDFLPDGTVSNGREMIYVDSWFLSDSPKTVYMTLVHEFAHILTFVSKYVTGDEKEPFPVWYMEMIAMTVEDAFQNFLSVEDSFSPKARLPLFNAMYSYGFTKWREDEFTAVSYSNAYAFGAYLARNYGGTALVREIAGNRGMGAASVVAALETLGHSLSFREVCDRFVYVILNPAMSDPLVPSLNRVSAAAGEKLRFDSIDLRDFPIRLSDGSILSGPAVFRPGISGRTDIGEGGFSVHRIGTGAGRIRVSKGVDGIDFRYVSGNEIQVPVS